MPSALLSARVTSDALLLEIEKSFFSLLGFVFLSVFYSIFCS